MPKILNTNFYRNRVQVSGLCGMHFKLFYSGDLFIFSPGNQIEAKSFEKFSFPYFNRILHVIIMGDNIQIGSEAFSHCENLEDVTVRGSVLKIDSAAFAGCINLRKVSIEKPSDDIVLGDDIFSDIPHEIIIKQG